MSSKCCQHQLRAVGATRFGIVHSRPGRISRRILDHNVAGCDAADSQFVPHCAAGHQATLTSVELSEETSQSARRALLRIAWALGSVALGVLAVSVACGIQGSSGLLATVAGSFRLKEHIAVTSAASGLAAGFLHTLCGPDHLAALTPLTIGRNRFSASLLGSLWGLGHSTGQLVLGLAFVLLKAQFTVFLPFLERWAGTIVGLTLLTIGGMGIYESIFANDDGENEDEAKLRDITSKSGSGEGKAAAATFGTGVLYGLQPDSLFVIIPALALPSTFAAFAYCMMFVIGTVLAMGGYTFFLGTASEELCRDRPWLQQNLSVVASCVAIIVGIMVLLSAFGVAVPLF